VSAIPWSQSARRPAFTPAHDRDAGRAIVPLFGAWQADLALQRQFHITEKMWLRFQGEFVNTFNHRI
jgi:hypothetical protein